ncbi:MAG: hypothetical protein JRJ12_09865 [Deltaproteobacteria bacterium]|nr:hypothetical protein [Deltaproteobacteria bacterium]
MKWSHVLVQIFYKARRTAIFCPAIFFLFASGVGLSATFIVDTTLDDPTKTDCTLTSKDCSLRGAISAANATPGKDLIQVPAGTYTLTNLGTGDDLNATGDLDITDSLTIEGAGYVETVIDGGARDRIIHIPTGTGIGVILYGLTLQNGSAPYGGGIANMGGDLTIKDCIVQENTAVGSSIGTIGGGILLDNDGMLTITNSFILNNRSGSAGGGIFVNQGMLNGTDINIMGNEASQDGGGIYMSNGVMTLLRSTIALNTASSGAGGGILTFYPTYEGVTSLVNCTVNLNQAKDGGGLYLSTSVPPGMEIRNCSIYGNEASQDGGGIYYYNNASGELIVVNSTIGLNKADRRGGGFYNKEGIAKMLFTTVTANRADDDDDATGDGGGFFREGGITQIKYTILAENQDRGGEAPNCSGSLVIVGNNLVDDPSGCTFAGTGYVITGLSPQLGTYGLHGNITGYYPLARTSPAVNACIDCLDFFLATVRQDQRGKLRPQAGRCDLGAYEVAHSMVPILIPLLLSY